MERVSYTQMCIVKIVPINELLASSFWLRDARKMILAPFSHLQIFSFTYFLNFRF